jgi:hypothetical protein
MAHSAESERSYSKSRACPSLHSLMQCCPYFGGCNPGDVSHAVIWESVSACRALRIVPILVRPCPWSLRYRTCVQRPTTECSLN